MYERYFGLDEKPFSITPDPRFLYLSERHAEALAHLQYGVMESGGFIQLTGEVGTGKTTVTRTLLNRLPEEVEIAAILNPRLTTREFLLTICEEFKLERPQIEDDGNKALVDALNRHLLECHAMGRRSVLIIDEAQNLTPEVLEQLRLLTNLETETEKLLQIILIGQPELRQTLARGDLRQLAQRITGRYHLETLTLDETAGYIRHRLDVAGAKGEIFRATAVWEIQRLSSGVPRLINVICDRALLGAYTAERHHVDRKLVRQAAAEVRGSVLPAPRRLPRIAAGAGLAVLATAGAVMAWQFLRSPPEPVSLASATQTDLTPVPAAAGVEAQASLTNVPRPGPSATLDVAEPFEEAPKRLDFDAVLRAAGPDTGTDRAFEVLFQHWDADFAATGRQPCIQAQRQGLRCEHQLGSWTLLRAMNRPAILSLVDNDGNAHHAVVTALSDGGARVQIGDAAYELSLEALSPHWFGEYLVLWRPHPEATELMLPGMRSAGVGWLRETLTSMDGSPPVEVSEPNYYDRALADRVRAFQRRHNLKADGKAGLQTLIAVNTALGNTGTPYLQGPG